MAGGLPTDAHSMASLGVPTAALNMSQSQAQWDAIAAIKSNSPFDTPLSGAKSSASTAAQALDAMLPGYGTMSTLGVTGAQSEESLAQVTERVRAAQSSTIDLFA
jgi:hypothetical protein